MPVRMGVLIATTLTVASIQASAQEARVVFGQGVYSCGSWTRARAQNGFQGYAQWIAGYLSAMNQDPTKSEALAGTDFNSLMAWIDKYCRANPVGKISEAALKLLEELWARARR